MDTETMLYQAQPHDAMRMGLAALKEDALPKHPVELIQRDAQNQAQAAKLQMLRDVYGEAMPMRMHIERQILSKFQRLPGIPSSQLGLEALTGTLDEFGFESFLGLPEHSGEKPADMRAQMEQRLGMGTAPQSRGVF
eukprot:CAMPEP_0119104090 /NCGR_PEP_ID=MMETSP1180-20130426/2397_1 /TAXON_ID=3052 ORGANISM="Chlamydomonas cf sp, Strain CCMP681" /NCGR_SAMPLE_ID=MMETSP1180 /ASSEMBLY_ACC=CAM_ASM_000741 /LENGTH=136 /DNA_ID=CAMNT_0007088761 /DNA_START=75 /DNA_END=485 /DNA_ORIENTATION=+